MTLSCQAKAPLARPAIRGDSSSGCPGPAPLCWRPEGDGVFMRLLFVFALTALLWVLPVVLGRDGADAFMRVTPPASEQRLLHEAKIVCGQTAEGFKCRNEAGGVRRGKMGKIPGASSGGSSGGATDGANDDGLPPASSDAGASPPSAAPTSCPRNTELLGGACVRYTASCRSGVPANTNVPPCQSAQEKLVCKIGSDGLRHCCCRLYDKR